jgi:hypothetical protein
MPQPIDALIVAPVLPLVPILATWWLPWENWIPWGKLPKAILGPYLLYASFVSWHFKFAWFVTAEFGMVRDSGGS